MIRNIWVDIAVVITLISTNILLWNITDMIAVSKQMMSIFR